MQQRRCNASAASFPLGVLALSGGGQPGEGRVADEALAPLDAGPWSKARVVADLAHHHRPAHHSMVRGLLLAAFHGSRIPVFADAHHRTPLPFAHVNPLHHLVTALPRVVDVREHCICVTLDFGRIDVEVRVRARQMAVVVELRQHACRDARHVCSINAAVPRHVPIHGFAHLRHLGHANRDFHLRIRNARWWTAQQLRNATPFGEGPQFIIRDRDHRRDRCGCGQ